jgi:glutamyl-tRNA reductase
MRIGVLGINYKSAEITTQEFISKACQKKLSKESPISEKYHCVILSTCNRTEIYFSADNLAEAHSDLLNLLREEVAIPFEHKLYSYFGFDCFLHLASVTSGLDSIIIGESEIQRQVKVSYEQALLYYSLPSCMHYLFQKCLKIGKQIRTHLPMQNQITISKVLFEISERFFKAPCDIPLLFIGNSEINRKVIAYFKRKGIHRITLCTRSLHSAQEMAKKDALSLLAWENLSAWQEFPLVICGSNVPHFVIKKPEKATQTQLIFDLSVPRNVDPQLKRHPSLTLLNMEELSILLQNQQQKNFLEINRAEAIILQGVQRHLDAYRQKEKRVLTCV